MKKFSEMTQSEINAMTDEEFNAISPFEKHSCGHCGYLKSALSWWCMNDDAFKFRGTRIPGIIKCTFWKPDWNHIDEKYRTPENGYVTPMKKIIEKKKTFFNKIKLIFN